MFLLVWLVKKIVIDVLTRMGQEYNIEFTEAE